LAPGNRTHGQIVLFNGKPQDLSDPQSPAQTLCEWRSVGKARPVISLIRRRLTPYSVDK
jgi:hypothetical protein